MTFVGIQMEEELKEGLKKISKEKNLLVSEYIRSVLRREVNSKMSKESNEDNKPIGMDNSPGGLTV